MSTTRLIAGFAAAAAAATATPARASAQHPHAGAPAASRVEIPPAMKAEHQEIHAELERATTLPGRVGSAARALATVLHPHFVREEQVALPPLGLLAPLTRGERPAGMPEVLAMTDSLRAELPRMLEEHEAIHRATTALLHEARTAKNARVVRLAESLALHAQTEEQVFYPAALLVGEAVRARQGAGADR